MRNISRFILENRTFGFLLVLLLSLLLVTLGWVLAQQLQQLMQSPVRDAMLI